MAKIDASFLILAGGKSRRMGRDKANLVFQGRSLLEVALNGARALGVDEILVSGSPEGRKVMPECSYLPDRYLGCGPLAGIYEGLLRSRHDRLLVVACDLPFLDYGIFAEMMFHAHSASAVVPSDGMHLQPLVAIYRKSCIPGIEEMLSQGRCRILDLYEKVSVVYFPVERNDISFFNVNSPEDYDRALRVSEGTKEVMDQ